MSEVEVPDPEVQRVLEERARRLARRPDPPAAEDAVEAVVFALGPERFAVEGRRVREVFRLQARSVLPGAPVPIAGVTAHRGELLTLLDLRSTLGLSASALNDLARVLVLERGRTRAGLLVDRVEGLRLLAGEELRPPPPDGPAPREYLRGVTDDSLIVLDVDMILRLFDPGVPS